VISVEKHSFSYLDVALYNIPPRILEFWNAVRAQNRMLALPYDEKMDSSYNRFESSPIGNTIDLTL